MQQTKRPGRAKRVKIEEPKEVLSVDEVLEREDVRKFEEKKAPYGEDVEVEIYNIEEPGAPINVVYGPANNLYKKTFLHGGKYKIPKEIIKWLESRQVPLYKWRPDGTGAMQKTLIGYKQRFSCKGIF